MTSVGVYRKWRGGGGGCGVTCGVTVLEVVRPVFDESWHGVETFSQLLEPGEVCLGQGLKRIEAVTGTMQGCNTPGSGVPLGLRHGRARSGSALLPALSYCQEWVFSVVPVWFLMMASISCEVLS